MYISINYSESYCIHHFPIDLTRIRRRHFCLYLPRKICRTAKFIYWTLFSCSARNTNECQHRLKTQNSKSPDWESLSNPSELHFRDVQGGFRGRLIGLPWCRETPVSRTAVRLIAVRIPAWRSVQIITILRPILISMQIIAFWNLCWLIPTEQSAQVSNCMWYTRKFFKWQKVMDRATAEKDAAPKLKDRVARLRYRVYILQVQT